MADNQSAGITAEVIPASVIDSIMAYYGTAFMILVQLIIISRLMQQSETK